MDKNLTETWKKEVAWRCKYLSCIAYHTKDTLKLNREMLHFMKLLNEQKWEQVKEVSDGQAT